MAKIEILTPEPEKALPILRDALAWQKRLLAQSLTRTQERVQELAASLQVDPELLLAGVVPHPEDQDMDLLELEGGARDPASPPRAVSVSRGSHHMPFRDYVTALHTLLATSTLRDGDSAVLRGTASHMRGSSKAGLPSLMVHNSTSKSSCSRSADPAGDQVWLSLPSRAASPLPLRQRQRSRRETSADFSPP